MITSHQTPANLLHKSYGHGSDMSPADTLFDLKKKKKTTSCNLNLLQQTTLASDPTVLVSKQATSYETLIHSI